MSGERGPLSKPGAVRRNKGKQKTALAGTTTSAPDLVGDYSAATALWYEAWTLSPQAEHFAATDWQRLLMIAPLIEAYYARPTPQLMAEIRQNEAKLGATAADRERLGWKLDAPPEKGATSKPAGSRAKPDPRLK